MSLNAAVWQIIFDAAERDDAEPLRAALRAELPVQGKERTWTKITTALSEGASSARPQPGDGHITGSTGALLLSGATVTSPRQGATHSGALAAVGGNLTCLPLAASSSHAAGSHRKSPRPAAVSQPAKAAAAGQSGGN